MLGYNVLAGANISDPAVNAAPANLLANLGDLNAFARRIGVANLVPVSGLCSTGYCLANQAQDAAAYVVYAPAGGAVGVDLSATMGTMFYEWFDPATGKSEPLGIVEAGGVQTLAAPFAGDAVLYIYSAPEMNLRLYLPTVINEAVP
jgi:hypothetical protein